MLLWSDLMWPFDQIQQIQRLKCQEQIYEENQCISVHDKHKVHPDEYITTKNASQGLCILCKTEP